LFSLAVKKVMNLVASRAAASNRRGEYIADPVTTVACHRKILPAIGDSSPR
jgi:hypothetical protein